MFSKQSTIFILAMVIVPTLNCMRPWNPGQVDDKPLHTSVLPRSYNLKLHPFIDQDFFNGSVQINIICHETTNKIVLHAHPELQIITETLRLISEENSAGNSITNITRSEENQTVTFSLEKSMKVGESYKLYIDFSGIFHGPWQIHAYQPGGSGGSGGFYKMEYDNMKTGNKSSYLMTNMNPNFARQVFPCFDNLHFKATFNISVARQTSMSSLSVMPIESTEIVEGTSWVWDHFQTTPPISTASLNILVTDLERDSPMKVTTKGGSYPVTFHHQPNWKPTENAQTEMDKIPLILEVIEELLGVPYPVPKLDIVQLPQFYGGILESSMGTVYSHEISDGMGTAMLIPKLLDQWLAHAVTPQTWSNFNITKIISQYYMKQISRKVKIDRNGLEMGAFGYPNHLYNTLSSSPWSHVGGTEPWNPLNNLKGEWFLKMVASAISEETFNKAMKSFLIENMYNTFTEYKFWNAFTNQGWHDETLPKDLTVEMLANSWLHKSFARYPLLSVTRNYEDNTALLEQNAYINSMQWNLTEEEKKLLWWIPISYISPCNLDPNTVRPAAWMKEERQSSISNLPDSDSFIIVNPMDSGLFLVNYDQHNWNLITKNVASTENKIPKESLKKVLQDSLILAEGGRLNYGTALNVTMLLANTSDFSVWSIFLGMFFSSFQSQFYEGTTVENSINNYVRELVGPFFETLREPYAVSNPNYPVSMHSYRYDYANDNMWYMARTRLSRVGYQPFINKTNNKGNLKMPTYTLEDPDSGLTIYCPEFMKNSSYVWKEESTVFNNYLSGMPYEEVYFWQKSFAKCPGYDDLVDRILSTALTDNSDPQWYVMNGFLISSEASVNKTLKFCFDNFDAFQANTYRWDSLMFSAVSKIRSEEQLNTVIDFRNQHKDVNGSYQWSLNSSIEIATQAIQWCKLNLQDIEKWTKEVLPMFQSKI